MSRGRARRRGALALVVLALLLALGLTALVVAYAPAGSGSRRASKLSSPPPNASPGRLLPLRAADPGGGAPWGMRIVRTSDGLLCAQVGRVSHGALGQLGLDGAYGDDGRFHPVAQGEFAQVTITGSVGENAECVATKETFSGTIHGLDRNALENPQHDTSRSRTAEKSPTACSARMPSQ